MPLHDHNDEYPRLWIIESMTRRIEALEQKLEALCKHQKVILEKTDYIVKDEASHE